MHGNPGSFAEILVVGTFIGILKSPPPTDVVDEDCFEICPLVLYVVNEFLQRSSARYIQAAFSLVGIGGYDLEVSPLSVFANRVILVGS